MEITDFEQLVDRITTKVMARLKEKTRRSAMYYWGSKDTTLS